LLAQKSQRLGAEHYGEERAETEARKAEPLIDTSRAGSTMISTGEVACSVQH
jgi:hypothetical protein